MMNRMTVNRKCGMLLNDILYVKGKERKKVNSCNGLFALIVFFIQSFSLILTIFPVEYEAEVEEERLRKEREARERQDVMTLGM